MLIVDTDVVRVERQLRAGELTCPSCGAVLAPWGHGRPREIRGDLGSRLFVRPRRSRCTCCQVTHVLLPELLWPRRADAAEGYRKAQAQAAKVSRKVARQREDTGRKWAKSVMRDHDAVAVEDFRPKFLAKTTMAGKAADAAIAATKQDHLSRRLRWRPEP